MSNTYPEFIQEKKNGSIKFTFIESKNISSLDMPITAILGFVFLGDALTVIKDKNEWWNIVGGKIEQGEDWSRAIEREAYEEAGVYIKKESLEIIGYFKCENLNEEKKSGFSTTTIMPVCLGYISNIDRDWKPMETLERRLLSFKYTKRKFEQSRKDNDQLLKILEYVENIIKSKNITIKYEYMNAESDPKIASFPALTTQCMGFIKYLGEYCIVRDFDETHYSLPGGGCELGETPVNCQKREALEEAQINLTKCKLLGRILVSFISDGKTLSQVTHNRYFSEIDNLPNFEPRKNGMEVVERDFVNLDEIKNKVKLLQNSTGDILIEQIRKL